MFVQYGGILVHCLVVFVYVCAVRWYPSALPCGVHVCVQYGGILVHCVVVFVCVYSTEVS